jgi:hypothetical protein
VKGANVKPFVVLLGVALSGCASSADFVVVGPGTPDGSIRTAGNFVTNDRQDLELNPSCERSPTGYHSFALELANFGPQLGIAKGASLTIVAQDERATVFEASEASKAGVLADGRAAEVCRFGATYNQLLAIPPTRNYSQLTVIGEIGSLEARIHPVALQRIRDFALDHPPAALARSGGTVPLPKTALGRSDTNKTLGALAGLAVAAAGVLGYAAVDDDIGELRDLGIDDDDLETMKRRRLAWGLVAIGGLLFGFSAATD